MFTPHKTVIKPWHACAVTVTILGLYVRLHVSLFASLLPHFLPQCIEEIAIPQDSCCKNFIYKMAIFIKLLHSKVTV